ncbi:hypothetical protein RUM44_013451 [Polyplax serrata]|uniref:Uncharacterized protein n=1 Tax=Polyplax serrata TaxID=468196 RepID=A0ABR1BHV0_POLSC
MKARAAKSLLRRGSLSNKNYNVPVRDRLRGTGDKSLWFEYQENLMFLPDIKLPQE